MKKGKRAKVALVFILAIAFGVAGCQPPAVNDVASLTVKMREVTDDLGRTVNVPVRITRVVSTAPSVTEMIFAAGGGDRLVGVTTFCNYPEEAKAVAKIGDTMTPNMETIVALKPDVVFVSTASQLEAFTRTLEKNGIAVYVSNPMSLDDVFKGLLGLGELLDTHDQAEAVVTDLQGRMLKVMAVYSGLDVPRVFVQISKEPLFTIGKQSFLTEIIRRASGESVTKEVETPYPKLSKETALALQPDRIVLSESPDNQAPNEAFRNSPAVKNGHVYTINADILSRPGPRLVDALEQLAKALHPRKKVWTND